MSAPAFATRHAHPGDHPFILATWLKSHASHGYGVKRIERPAYFRYHEAAVKVILGRAQTLVATPPDSPDTILGYAVTEAAGEVLHWVHVKQAFRRFGVATALLKAAEPRLCTYLAVTDATTGLLRGWGRVQYNPYWQPGDATT